MNRVVYDSVDPPAMAPGANPDSNQGGGSLAQPVVAISENEQLNNQESEESNIYSNNSSGGVNNQQPSDPKQCDNDQNLTPYYTPKSGSEDYTLVFESRFESGNLRRAI